MAQIGISVDEHGYGEIFTDRNGTLDCEKKNCNGKVTFTVKLDEDTVSVCNKCGQKYTVKISG